MNFNINYEEIDNYTVKPGKYEAVVKSATTNENKNGKQRIQIVLTIRNDVEQSGKNKCYFYDIYKALDPSPNDNAIGGFIFSFVMKIAQACSIPANSTFESLDDLLKALVDKPVLMTVGNHRLPACVENTADRRACTDLCFSATVVRFTAPDISSGGYATGYA